MIDSIIEKLRHGKSLSDDDIRFIKQKAVQYGIPTPRTMCRECMADAAVQVWKYEKQITHIEVD